MQKSDFEQFRQLWTAVCNLYNREVNDMSVGMAFRALSRFDLPDVRRGLDAHVQDSGNGQFMPKPADIVRHIEGDPDSRALQAWTKVRDAIGRQGPYKSIIFDEPEIMACIEAMGGWQDLCRVTDDELPFKSNEFVKRYRGYLNRPPEGYPRKLVGIAEAQNNANGQKTRDDDIVLIGDTQKAALVYQGGTTFKSGPKRLSDVLKTLGVDERET